VNMSFDFIIEFRANRGMEWLTWIGSPMIFDGGLCVNRTAEEHKENNKHIQARLMV